MDSRRTAVIDRLVTDGYTTQLYCTVFYALKESGYEVDDLLDPVKDAYKLTFDLEGTNVINPSVKLLAYILETYPIDILESITDRIELEETKEYDAFDWDTYDDTNSNST